MKSNKTFMILSAFGIVFVVDAHALTSLQPMTYYFDYNTFFMPMFVFISGYFFREQNVEKFGNTIKKKIRKMLMPYFLWSVVYSILELILRHFDIIRYDLTLDWKQMLIRPWTSGYMCDLVAPTWFVITLFLLQIIYLCIRKIFGRYWNSITALIIFIFIGAGTIILSKHGYNQGFFLSLLKVGFFLQFYELGIVYKKYIEKYYCACPKIIIMVAAIVINTLLWYFYHEKILFLNLAFMSSFLTDNIFLPLITSVTGISFWLCIAMILTPALGDNKLVNFISDHTYEVMTHHYFFFNVYNCILYLISRFMIEIPFDTIAFRSVAWYRFEPIIQFRVFYMLAGVSGPLITIFVYHKIKDYIKNKQNIRRAE